VEEESNIIKGLKEGRENAYRHLFESYYTVLSVFADKYLKDLEASKEIVQDLFVHLYENRNSLLINSSLQSYLYRSVRNRCLNHLKHQKINKNHLENLQQAKEENDDPESLYRETEFEYRIFQIISGLPPRCREIFIMSRVEGKNNGEIAAIFQISLRTVETQISKALKTLRKSLRD
jgi:RNA polymerase sigma-70 factor (ECF subfamily)